MDSACLGGTELGGKEQNVRAVVRAREALAVARRARYLRDALEVDGPVFELRVSGDRAVVRGDCDRSVAETLEDWLATFDDRPHVVVDLSGVTFLSAAALRALLSARRRNPGLRFVDASAPVRRMLDLTGTESLLDDPRGSP